jgi:hypothetical protein
MASLPRVSDHALIRWLERKHKLDVEYFRSDLADVVGPVAGVGDVVVKKDGLKFLVRGDTVVTVIEQDGDPSTAWHHV